MNQESWSLQRATGGWIVGHNWQDENGNYRSEMFVFTTAEELSQFFNKLTNQE